MFDPASFVKAAAFAAIYAGIEARYVNRMDAEWTRKMEGFFEKPAVWKVSPYQLYLLFPLFVVAASAPSAGAWAGNVLLIMLLEDALYFVWRRRWVEKGEWTTTLMGSFSVGGRTVPVWWIPAALGAAALYLLPA